MLEILKTAGFIVAVIFTIIIGFYFLVKILRNLDTIFKSFISALKLILYFVGVVLGIFGYHFIFSILYVHNNTLGVAGVIITMSTLIYYLQKKFDILTFFRQITGISEYDREATKSDKFFKILQIIFFTTLFLSIFLTMFLLYIFSIFKPSLAI